MAALERTCRVVEVAAGPPERVLDAELTDRDRAGRRLGLLRQG